MSAEARLKEKNIALPKQATPMANYVSAVRTGNLLFLAGHGPVREGDGVLPRAASSARICPSSRAIRSRARSA